MANPEITNNDTKQIPVFNPTYDDAVLTSAGAGTWVKGTVLAFSSANGDYRKTVSGTADVANAKAILPVDVVFAGAESKNTRIINGGEIQEDLLVFDGADTINTIPASAADSFKVQLRDYGIRTLTGMILDELDNQ
ncbi:hypothetical protein KAR91_30325 [Candidatus Pacearchaeota archaeon]|nr:hypothetical protein [Candidatus Pacearchaeota archaeon]